MKLLFYIIILYSSSCFASTKQIDHDSEKRFKYLKRFSDVLYIIEKSYVKKKSANKLIQSAITGMVKQLDPYSYFLPPEEFKNFITQAKGQFSGFGMELEMKNKKPVIISVLQNSPARQSGMKPGQIILQINNKKTAGLSKQEISKLLKSKRGTQFKFVVQDADLKNIYTLKLRTQFISFKSVIHKDLKDQFFYIRINAFTDRTAQEIQKIIKKYKKPAGLLLDLRGNPGGLFNSAIQVADLFIKKGIIVSVKGRAKNEEKLFKAHEVGTVLNCPILVLIDGYSASAAEILAGALKDNKRAYLLGRTSFGKGSVQTLIPLDHGSAVKLTVAYYYTPNGLSINKKGIKPHVEFKKPKYFDKQKSIIFTSKQDTDFHKALSFLKVFKFFNESLN